MNKQDIANIRKQFKLDNDLLKITDLFHVYIRKDSSDIYHQESQPFSMLEREQQELLLHNFKKVLTGKLDVKLFEVRFQRDVENHSQQMLQAGLQVENVEDWKDQMRMIVEKMLKDTQHEMDIVVTFIRGQYCKPTKRNSDESEVSDWDEVFTHPFILCSINKTEQPKRTLLFDFIEKEFKSNIIVDSIINLTTPIGGFLYPTFTDHWADVNHILYSAGKANQPDIHFIENVLNGEDIMTAQEDKAVFEEIVKEVVGDQVNTHTLANVYEEINQMVDEAEDEKEDAPTLDYKDIEHVLKVSGVEDVQAEKVEMAFQKVIDDEKYELKASSIIPNFTSKSIKINTKVANISISPKDLKYVKQIHVNGKRCLLIEVDEDTEIEGFKLMSETTFG